jgi:hypothetical protein
MLVFRGSRAGNEVSWSSCWVPRRPIYEPAPLSECFLIRRAQEIIRPCLRTNNVPPIEVKLHLMVMLRFIDAGHLNQTWRGMIFLTDICRPVFVA